MKKLTLLILLVLAGSLSGQNVNIARIASGPILNNARGIFNNGSTILHAANRWNRSILIKNIGTLTIWLGPHPVTSSNGIRLLAGESVILDTIAEVRCISPGGANPVAYMEVSDQ